MPPPRQGRLLELLPEKFSTFLLAMERTRLGRDLHETPQRGGTVFAPTNDAFERMGPSVNTFLFSDEGRDYLRALMRYHVVANETLYSDAFYERQHERRERAQEERERDDRNNWQVELRTLLSGKRLRIQVSRWLGVANMEINDRVHVSVQDGIARDGVVQVVDTVLMPPRGRRPAEIGARNEDDQQLDWDDVSVDDLKDRLRRHLDDDWNGDDEEEEQQQRRRGDSRDRRDRDDDRDDGRDRRDRDEDRNRSRNDRDEERRNRRNRDDEERERRNREREDRRREL